MKNPRKPTKKELRQLKAYLSAKWGKEEDLVEFLDDAYIAVFDDYGTSSPGYIGRVLMMVVWTGAPSQYNAYVYTRDENGLLHFQESDFYKDL